MQPFRKRAGLQCPLPRVLGRFPRAMLEWQILYRICLTSSSEKKMQKQLLPVICMCWTLSGLLAYGQQPRAVQDAKNTKTKNAEPFADPDLAQYGIYQNKAPRPTTVAAATTSLPLQLAPGQRIALIGNTLLDRARHFGHLEAMLHTQHPQHHLVVRHLAWSADTPDLQPRPDNFADLEQHLTHEKIDVIIAAFGFNESFAGPDGLNAFRQSLSALVKKLTTRAYNGKTAPQVILLSPIANENIDHIPAADRNNANLALYSEAIQAVAKQHRVAFADVFTPSRAALRSLGNDLTINGVHLNDQGYQMFAGALFEKLFGSQAPTTSVELRQLIVDKNEQYFRRYRPLNTFYYTGGRSKSYGYLDFLPAMRNFDILVANREQRIWQIAAGDQTTKPIDDSNLPPLPKPRESRGANTWLSAADEQKAFDVDPRFEVNLFASEEEFPEIAAPIQMRWDAQGRLWVSTSTTYPHVYPGNAPNDKLVVLEDTDRDGKADKSTVFADDLHIPLSFELGDGGVYVSEEPHLTFLKDTDGDGKADFRRRLFTGFGTEDSHHSLHDFVWTPDGDLIFREGIFHHSQVETAYGPVRQRNSGWFRLNTKTQRLTSFGTYHSTNPWGVTFDDWGQHVASHPIYAAAFHSLDPAYPNQHPRPNGLRAYSGTCGQEFVDFATFPEELQGGYIKVRYKPTNRVEIHKWKPLEYGYDEEYVGDILFSKNLSFIPVDIRFGPRGALYVCDWYNPVKGHAQYSLRDERRDRHSGRIWRITTKGKSLQDPPKIAGASTAQLLAVLQRPEYRYRYWAKRELRERPPAEVRSELSKWVNRLHAAGAASDPRYWHHLVEALWIYRHLDELNEPLLRQILSCNEPLARAAGVEQLRHWHSELDDATALLRQAVNDPSPIVRMQGVICASYMGTQDAFKTALDVFQHPSGGHLNYAIRCAFGSHTLKPYWEQDDQYGIAKLLLRSKASGLLKEPTPNATQAQFDSQPELKTVKLACKSERMQFTVARFDVRPGQPVKIVFTNPDATDHNLLVVQPGAWEEVGIAANLMAKNPKFANSDFIPADKRDLILHASPMIGPTRKSLVHVLRFQAPSEPGVYPYVCTFPGHWIIMHGAMVVANNEAEAIALWKSTRRKIVQEWTFADLAELADKPTDVSQLSPQESRKWRDLGLQSFAKANCTQCHLQDGVGVKLGPDLIQTVKRLKGDRAKLLQHILKPSAEIHPDYQMHLLLMDDGRVLSGLIAAETPKELHLIPNLAAPNQLVKVKRSAIEEQKKGNVSAMPAGLLNVLNKDEIAALLHLITTPTPRR